MSSTANRVQLWCKVPKVLQVSVALGHSLTAPRLTKKKRMCNAISEKGTGITPSENEAFAMADMASRRLMQRVYLCDAV